MTKIYRPEISRDGVYWDDGVARPGRNLSAVTLDAHIKDPLVNDIEDYSSPHTRKFYITNAVPWRRGYLPYGPPGTGKTTMATAIAGQYGLNVYLLSLSNPQWNDTMLEQAFEALPTKCIVLLKDIDSAGTQRDDMTKSSGMKQKKHKSRRGRVSSRYDGVFGEQEEQ